MATNSEILAALRSTARRVRGMVSRGVVAAVGAASKMQSLQVTIRDGETVDDVEHFEPYGLTSRATPGAEAVVISVGGLADHPVAIVVADRRYRVTGLAAGEVCLHDDQGQRVTLYRDRVEITAPKVVINSADVQLGGAGLLALADGVVVAQGIDSFTGATYGVLGNASSVVKAKKS